LACAPRTSTWPCLPSRRPPAPAQCVVSSGVLKYWRALPPSVIAYCAGLLALHVLVIAWTTVAPRSYARWRGLMVLLLRLDAAFNPAAPVAFQDIQSRLGHLPGGPLAPASFLLALLFVSDALRLAIVGFGLRQRAPAHALLQLAMVARAWAWNEPVCEAVLAADGRQAVRAAAAGTLRSAPDAAAAAAALLGTCHSTLSLQTILLPQPQLWGQVGLAEECCVLLGWFQVSLGLLLPLAVHLVLESRAYCVYRQGMAGAAAALVRRSEQGRAMPKLYRLVWGWVSRAHWGLLLWIGMCMLAMAWEGVTSVVMMPKQSLDGSL
jgi:hypothetical protein